MPMSARNDGSRDVSLQIRRLEARLPERLRPLAALAFNYRWCWAPGGEDLFREVDPRRWERSGHDPLRLLGEARAEDLERVAGDRPLTERIAAAARALADELSRDIHGPVSAAAPVAFLCAEFG